jgi:hypothetical protein
MGGINFLPYYATHTPLALEARIKHLSQERSAPSLENFVGGPELHNLLSSLIQFFRFDTPPARRVSYYSDEIMHYFRSLLFSKLHECSLWVLFQESWPDQTDQVIWLMPSCPSRGAPSPLSPPPRPFTCPRSCFSLEPSITSCSETSQYINFQSLPWNAETASYNHTRNDSFFYNFQQYIKCSLQQLSLKILSQRIVFCLIFFKAIFWSTMFVFIYF